MTTSRSKVLFHEEQHLNMRLLSIIMISSGSFAAGVVGFAIRQDHHASPVLLWSVVAAMIISEIAMLGFMALVKMITEIREDGIFVRMMPLKPLPKTISVDGIVQCKSITYSPLKECRGCGGLKQNKQVYRTVGNKGVRIEYANGQSVLIGSQRPDTLCRIISELIQIRK